MKIKQKIALTIASGLIASSFAGILSASAATVTKELYKASDAYYVFSGTTADKNQGISAITAKQFKNTTTESATSVATLEMAARSPADDDQDNPGTAPVFSDFTKPAGATYAELSGAVASFVKGAPAKWTLQVLKTVAGTTSAVVQPDGVELAMLENASAVAASAFDKSTQDVKIALDGKTVTAGKTDLKGKSVSNAKFVEGGIVYSYTKTANDSTGTEELKLNASYKDWKNSEKKSLKAAGSATITLTFGDGIAKDKEIEYKLGSETKKSKLSDSKLVLEDVAFDAEDEEFDFATIKLVSGVEAGQFLKAEVSWEDGAVSTASSGDSSETIATGTDVVSDISTGDNTIATTDGATAELVSKIRALNAEGKSVAEIAKLLGVSEAYVKGVLNVNPGTGVVIALIPMGIAAAAAVVSKKK